MADPVLPLPPPCPAHHPSADHAPHPLHPPHWALSCTFLIAGTFIPPAQLPPPSCSYLVPSCLESPPPAPACLACAQQHVQQHVQIHAQQDMQPHAPTYHPPVLQLLCLHLASPGTLQSQGLVGMVLHGPTEIPCCQHSCCSPTTATTAATALTSPGHELNLSLVSCNRSSAVLADAASPASCLAKQH